MRRSSSPFYLCFMPSDCRPRRKGLLKMSPRSKGLPARELAVVGAFALLLVLGSFVLPGLAAPSRAPEHFGVFVFNTTVSQAF